MNFQRKLKDIGAFMIECDLKLRRMCFDTSDTAVDCFTLSPLRVDFNEIRDSSVQEGISGSCENLGCFFTVRLSYRATSAFAEKQNFTFIPCGGKMRFDFSGEDGAERKLCEIFGIGFKRDDFLNVRRIAYKRGRGISRVRSYVKGI